MATYRISPGGFRPSGKIGGGVFRSLVSQGYASVTPGGHGRNAGFVDDQLQANELARGQYKQLTNNERESWDAMAAAYQTDFGFSAPLNMSGHHLFLRTATALLSAGVTAPPDFAVLQWLGRRQAVPIVYARPESSELLVGWVRGLVGNWFPSSTWTRIRRTAVTPPSVKRPPQTLRTLGHVNNGMIPVSPFAAPLVLSDVPFERATGWQRCEFATWDRFGWWTNVRQIIYPVYSEALAWFIATGSFAFRPGGSWIEYKPPLLRIRWSDDFPSQIEEATVGTGQDLQTVGAVASFVNAAFHQPFPWAFTSDARPSDGLRPIVRQRTNPRSQPVPFVFDV